MAGQSSKEWLETLARLKGANEEVAFQMLCAEKAGKARHAYIDRIYGRYNLLRAERERLELFKPVAQEPVPVAVPKKPPQREKKVSVNGQGNTRKMA